MVDVKSTVHPMARVGLLGVVGRRSRCRWHRRGARRRSSGPRRVSGRAGNSHQPSMATLRRVNACPACGGPISPWLRARGSEPDDRATYDLWRCGRCGGAGTGGAAPRAGAHHQGAHAPAPPRPAPPPAPLLAPLPPPRPAPPRAPPAAPVLDRSARGRLALLGAPRGSLLDVGAGRGRFVAAARRAGWDASGIEPSARGVAAASSAYGVALERRTLAEAAGAFDVVSLWHVLEHLDDPGAAIAQARALLAPGGMLLIGVPNLGSAQAQIGRDRWFH